MPAFTLETRGDVKGTQQIKFGTLEIKSSTTVQGWKISGTVLPATPVITKEGLGKFTPGAEVNVEVANKDGVTIFLDNLQLVPDKKFAPRFKIAKKIVVGDATFACDATFAMKGNTAEKATPSTKQILKLTCKAPKVAGFSPTVKYDSGKDTATLEVAGAVDKATVTLKGDFDVPKKSKKSLSATIAYPLPQGIKAKVEIKDDKSGKLELTKDRFTLEAPMGKGFKAPTPADMVLKIKFTKNFDAPAKAVAKVDTKVIAAPVKKFNKV